MPHPGLAAFQQAVFNANIAIDSEYLDQQLSQITGYWVEGELPGIVTQGQTLLKQNIYDLRLTSYYLYSLWAGSDTCGLADLLSALHNLLSQPVTVWASPEVCNSQPKDADDTLPTLQPDSPSRAALHHLMQSSLGMLFRRIDQRISRFATTDNEEEHPCEVIQHCQRLEQLLQEYYELPEIAASLTDIARNHEDACQHSQPPDTDIPADDEAALAEDGNEKSQENAVQGNPESEETQSHAKELAPDETATPVQDFSQQPPAPTQIPDRPWSIAMQALLDNMQLFETLMQDKERYKAAIVFENIQYELEHFNPLRYLPELFSRYCATRALFAPQLQQLVEQHDPVQWQSLQDYLLVDPKGFITLPVLFGDEPDSAPPLGQDTDAEEEEFDPNAFRHQHPMKRGRMFDNDD